MIDGRLIQDVCKLFARSIWGRPISFIRNLRTLIFSSFFFHRDLNCNEVTGAFKYILLSSSILNFIGFLICSTFLCLLCVKNTVKRKPYSHVRTTQWVYTCCRAISAAAATTASHVGEYSTFTESVYPIGHQHMDICMITRMIAVAKIHPSVVRQHIFASLINATWWSSTSQQNAFECWSNCSAHNWFVLIVNFFLKRTGHNTNYITDPWNMCLSEHVDYMRYILIF